MYNVLAISRRLKLFRIENSKSLNRSPPCRTIQFTGVLLDIKTNDCEYMRLKRGLSGFNRTKVQLKCFLR